MAKYCQQQFKQGYSTVGGKTHWFRSGLEVRWARYLQILKELDEIQDWFYEPKTFWFERIKRGTNSYKPDFRIALPEGHIWHEVKGTGLLKQKDVTKFRRMVQDYPNERIVLVIQRIPQKTTKKNMKTMLLLDRCCKYVVSIIEAEKLLKKNGM